MKYVTKPLFQSAVSKRRETERLSLDGKIGQSESIEIGNRTDTLSYALMAEINHFHDQKNVDMKEAHQKFLREQIQFYQKVRLRMVIIRAVKCA